MPPRSRTATSDAYHGSFDPGVTGRRTGVAPPTKVRRTSNGIEAFSDYFNSPRKDPSVSPIRSPSKRTNDDQIPQRMRNDRPDMFHEIGERGRKTGISPPKNSTRDENGFEDFDNYLIKATEQTNKGIARERRKSMRRKSTGQALHNRKLSVATFVDDDDDDDEFMEESMSLATPDTSALQRRQSRSSHLGSAQSNPIDSDQRKTRSRISDAIDQSIRTPTGSDLIDFDVVPEGPIHSHSRHKSHDEQPMTIQDDEQEQDEDEDDIQNSGGMVANEYDEESVVSGELDAPPPPPDSVEDEESDNPAGLEDIAEVEEEEEDHETTAGPNDHADSSNPKPPERPKPQKKNHRPPPPAGVRRGQRQRFERLAHWRGERVVYGRSVTPDGNQKVIGMVDVVRVPTEPPESFAASRRNRRGMTKIKSESVAPQEIHDNRQPEEGWDSKTLPNGIVYSSTKHKDIERAVVCTKNMVTIDVEGKAGVPNSFEFQRVFKHSDFIAGGFMYIPVGGGKPLKPSKDNCYFFTVVEGAVSVHVHRTTFVVAPHGVFWIPRGNVYSIQNISERTAKLSFAQARRATDADAEIDSDDIHEEHSMLQNSSNDPSTSTSIPQKAGRLPHPDKSLTHDPTNKSTKTRKNLNKNKKKVVNENDTSASTNTSNPPGKKKPRKVLGMKKKKKNMKQKQKQKEQPDEEEPDEEQQQEEEREEEGEEEEEEEAQSS
ncbi:hypothetical protein PGTUg99_037141 [Puccinia graminis f. sp. tritici]|uniref:CENP-C homolog n=1 Tax=Puccinia graminis f. sp. tritici TaxID=56615 RepID=A0A5B0PMN3_PUCGR|nr:hypothetical protein PGTUg99_037141 [Puccinia graminis f. sp. tritici]